MTCDVCGQDWEKEFFCNKCSSKGILTEVSSPKLIWDGTGEEHEETEEYTYSDVCGNCCTCAEYHPILDGPAEPVGLDMKDV